jgi:nicotinamidase-related amidase
VHPALFKALSDWETGSLRTVEYVLKGMNPWTEHFSAIRAEVPDPGDPATQLNRGLIEAVEKADFTAIGGEALSHCVASTCRDIVANLSDPRAIERIYLLPDTTSSVAGFEELGTGFLREMGARGMKMIAADEFLKNV